MTAIVTASGVSFDLPNGRPLFKDLSFREVVGQLRLAKAKPDPFHAAISTFSFRKIAVFMLLV
jgi:hypothetical protein